MCRACKLTLSHFSSLPAHAAVRPRFTSAGGGQDEPDPHPSARPGAHSQEPMGLVAAARPGLHTGAVPVCKGTPPESHVGLAATHGTRHTWGDTLAPRSQSRSFPLGPLHCPCWLHPPSQGMELAQAKQPQQACGTMTLPAAESRCQQRPRLPELGLPVTAWGGARPSM